MNKTVSLVIGILAVINVAYSFSSNSDTQSIFGFEMNIWVYRLIWSFMAIVILYGYYKKRTPKNN